MDCSTTGLPISHCLLEFAQVYVHWAGDAVQSSHPLPPLLLLPSVFSSIRVFSNELAFCIRWPQYWSFSFSISPFSEYSGCSIYYLVSVGLRASQVVLVVKNLPANAGDTGNAGSLPGLGRSPGVGNGNPLQYACLEKPMDRGAWRATVRGVTKNQTWLST